MTSNLTAARLLVILIWSVSPIFAQKKTSPYACGYFPKSFTELKDNYNRYSSHLGVNSGETVASVGASNGYIEVQIACFVPDVLWTIQDIDSVCLNEFPKVLAYHEKLSEKKVPGRFDLVLGALENTNLRRSYYDRILLVNVYHELTERQPVMTDIYGALKENGLVVLMERMATKPGERHGDCKHPKLLEAAFLNEMKSFGFELARSTTPDKRIGITFFTFKKQ